MFYDTQQFNKDLSLIATVFGERKPRGFYTEGVYEYDNIRIINPYVIEPQIFWEKTLIGKDDVKTDSFIAQYVMKKAMLAEELLEQRYNVK